MRKRPSLRLPLRLLKPLAVGMSAATVPCLIGKPSSSTTTPAMDSTGLISMRTPESPACTSCDRDVPPGAHAETR